MNVTTGMMTKIGQPLVSSGRDGNISLPCYTVLSFYPVDSFTVIVFILPVTKYYCVHMNTQINSVLRVH